MVCPETLQNEKRFTFCPLHVHHIVAEGEYRTQLHNNHMPVFMILMGNIIHNNNHMSVFMT